MIFSAAALSLRHDPSFADVAVCSELQDPRMGPGLLAHQTKESVADRTALQVPAKPSPDRRRRVVRSAHPPDMEIPLRALGFSSALFAEEMDLLTQAPELFLLLQSPIGFSPQRIFPPKKSMQYGLQRRRQGDQLTKMIESVGRSVLASTAVLSMKILQRGICGQVVKSRESNQHGVRLCYTIGFAESPI